MNGTVGNATFDGGREVCCVAGEIRGGVLPGVGRGVFFSVALCFSVSFPKICVIIPKN